MQKKHQITITDVAKSAGVAVGTVSRVFNNHADVNPEIKEKVWHAAHRLGYKRIRQRRASTEASAQQPSLTGDIGVVCFGMDDTLVQLPIVSSALQGIESALSSRGRSLLLANIPKGNRLPPFVSEGRVIGLILKGPNQGELPAESENELLRSLYRFPHVWLMGRLANAVGDHCNFDTDTAGRLAAEHLRAKGHRRVGFLNPKPGQNQFERVKHGFQAACLRLGLSLTLLESEAPTSFSWPLPAITLQDNVARLMQSWLALSASTRPTALFVPSDRTASQLYSAATALNLKVGSDLSVVSCNNERSIVQNLVPELTTIDVHADLIGQRAVDQLFWRIEHPGDPSTHQWLLEPTLVERSSVAQL
jgi:DNA-binding LacI/PurR family transcriptional regulator